ncbi:extensin-like domain-containing protein [Phytohalomonas tamaricis]|uniref:extensin-like domain-containing protein n=1 Tax=Phytohalomonas tamaricis TaxID=2081032 RepID=UPI0021D45FC0|nr:extensin family protein [Phytohalomonas tamaricis]
MRIVFLFFLCVLIVGGVGLWQQWSWLNVPRQYNPFAPLDITDEPTFVTQWKLKQLGDQPERCMDVLARARDEGAIDYSVVGDTTIGKCSLTDVVRVRKTGVQFNNSFLATCPLAVTWTMFERHGLQHAAQSVFGDNVTRVEHVGSFACRNIYHRKNARLSEHATAEAFDVTGFRLADGTRIRVLNDWDDEDKKSMFLHRAFEQACGFFGNALGPEYNAAHANHFHLGMRGFMICR